MKSRFPLTLGVIRSFVANASGLKFMLQIDVSSRNDGKFLCWRENFFDGFNAALYKIAQRFQ